MAAIKFIYGFPIKEPNMDFPAFMDPTQNSRQNSVDVFLDVEKPGTKQTPTVVYNDLGKGRLTILRHLSVSSVNCGLLQKF